MRVAKFQWGQLGPVGADADLTCESSGGPEEEDDGCSKR